MKYVAITSCSTGIAHTYMAAEALLIAAKEMGVEIKVETQGSIGAEDVLTDKDIREAVDDLVKFDKRYEPVPENVKVYENLFAIYRDIYESFDKNGKLEKYKVIKIERENGAAGLITKIKVDL